MEAGGLSELTPADPLAAVDWSAPWLTSLRALRPPRPMHGVGWSAWLGEHAQRRGLRSGGGEPLQFVDADDADGLAYEAHIAATGRVPTRVEGEGAVHDLFNAMVWLTMSRTKAALNARQAAQIGAAGIGNRRGAVRDAATLIDESGLIVACTDRAQFDEVREQLARHDWGALFLTHRGRWHRTLRPVVIGHALLEKLVRPYKAVTAAVMLLHVDPPDPDGIDAAAAAFVEQPDLAPSQLARLPVLGIPGWWGANESSSFYDDPEVFRPARAARVPVAEQR